MSNYILIINLIFSILVGLLISYLIIFSIFKCGYKYWENEVRSLYFSASIVIGLILFIISLITL